MRLDQEEIDAIATATAEKLREGGHREKLAPRLLSVEQAGEYLSRSPHSIRHLIKSGKLPAIKIDQRVQLDRRDLDRIIDASKEVAI